MSEVGSLTQKKLNSNAALHAPALLRAERREVSSYSFSFEESMAELGRFVAYAEESIRPLFADDMPKREAVAGMLSLLREMVRRESGVLNFEDGIKFFAYNLWADHPFLNCLLRLFQDLRGFLYAAAASPSNFDFIRARRDLAIILEWYSRRKRSLLLLEEQESRYRFESEELDRLFNLQVIEDLPKFGVYGLEIVCGLRLSGYKGRSLWFKVHLADQTAALMAREGPLSWKDGSSLGLSLVKNTKRERFVAIVPLCLEAQRTLVDELRIFVPYNEIDPAPTSDRLLLEAGVFDENGEQILTWTEEREIKFPSLQQDSPRVPAPQALGIWEQDAIRGDKLSNLTASAQPDASLLVSFELFLGAESSMQQMELQARFLDSEAELLESPDRQYMHSDGTFLIRKNVDMRQNLAGVAQHAELRVPFSSLKDVSAQEALYCELTLLEPSGRVICGSICALSEQIKAQILRENLTLAKSRVEDAEPTYMAKLTSFFSVLGKWASKSINGKAVSSKVSDTENLSVAQLGQ